MIEYNKSKEFSVIADRLDEIAEYMDEHKIPFLIAVSPVAEKGSEYAHFVTNEPPIKGTYAQQIYKTIEEHRQKMIERHGPIQSYEVDADGDRINVDE